MTQHDPRRAVHLADTPPWQPPFFLPSRQFPNTHFVGATYEGQVVVPDSAFNTNQLFGSHGSPILQDLR